MARLKARTSRIVDVTAAERDRLFEIFSKYYDAVGREQFDADFSAKDAVILLYTPDDGRLQGLSTLKNVELNVDGRRVRGVFSGDTVIEKAFWGQGSLGVEFLKYLFREMARAPLVPFYWFLISKGYKTYLLMANNFDEHWPRYEEDTPAFERAVMDAAMRDLYADHYDAARGLVVFDESHGQLRTGVAGIDDTLRLDNPRVAFFAEKNPGWMNGDELVCLARMRWSMPFTYWWKVITKKRAPKRRALPATARRGAP